MSVTSAVLTKQVCHDASEELLQLLIGHVRSGGVPLVVVQRVPPHYQLVECGTEVSHTRWRRGATCTHQSTA